MIITFTQWFKNFFRKQDYLASSQDIAELESRMRQIERENIGLFR